MSDWYILNLSLTCSRVVSEQAQPARFSQAVTGFSHAGIGFIGFPLVFCGSWLVLIGFYCTVQQIQRKETQMLKPSKITKKSKRKLKTPSGKHTQIKNQGLETWSWPAGQAWLAGRLAGWPVSLGRLVRLGWLACQAWLAGWLAIWPAKPRLASQFIY